MVLKSLPALLGALAALASAQTLGERMGGVSERILAKNGIEIGGVINAEYFNSGLDGSAKVDTLYSYETTQFTSFDLDMHYRPYDFVGARAILRFHQDWQTFFANRSRLLGARWLSMDGNIANTLSFNAGDFRQKYTPLTLWSPELDLLYEPGIFGEARARLMEEQFLGHQDRALQGLNLNFARRFNLPLTEFRIDAAGARIRKAEYLDSTGWQAQMLAPDNNGDGRRDILRLNTADLDRFLLAANSEALLWNNLVVGGSFLNLMDDRESFQTAPYSSRLIQDLIGSGLPVDGILLNGQDSVIARDLQVTAAHGGVDAAGFLNVPGLTLEFLGEFARSSESNRYAWHFSRDSNNVLVSTDPDLPGKDGQALNLKFQSGYEPVDKRFGMALTADYLKNEAAFSNPLAQSPVFVATRVMNTENDEASGALYSTFDALNNGVYKFTPSRATAYYQHAPLSKSSYRNSVFTAEDLRRFVGDPVLQLALPFGMATPNRSGFKVRLAGHWADALHATLEFASMKELEGGKVDDSVPAQPASFLQMGGGAKLELAKLMGMASPLDLSASFMRSESTRDSTAADLGSPKISTDLVMAGFTWRFFKKWGVLGGYQQASLTSPLRLYEARVPPATGSAFYKYALDESQNHFRLGLEYSLGKNAYLLLSGGMLQVERKRANLGSVQTGEPANPARNATSEFSQALSQALVKVRF